MEGEQIPQLPIGPESHVLVLTGAGVSAESGVPTFRGIGGLWEGHRVEEVASPRAFAVDPALVWRFYSMRRSAMAGIRPNAGHEALARLEERIGERFLLVTQNVDGLHRDAGSERVVELHGNLMLSRCSVCRRDPFVDRRSYADGEVPECELCRSAGRRSPIRPHIVWFGESIDERALQRIERFVEQAGRRLVFLAVGTSGVVYPAAAFVDVARSVGASTWLVNVEPSANAGSFDHVLLGTSGEVLPHFLSAAGA